MTLLDLFRQQEKEIMGGRGPGAAYDFLCHVGHPLWSLPVSLSATLTLRRSAGSLRWNTERSSATLCLVVLSLAHL